MEPPTVVDPPVFKDLERHAECPIKGMTIAILLIALQVVATICALVFERKDDRFEGDKLIYRS
jgi:hypothetical protein